MEDSLGIGADLEADMARHVDAYECEWAATLANPVRLERFRSVVNEPGGLPRPARVEIRGQRVPS
jgi:nitrite reductase (NADH) large subunit